MHQMYLCYVSCILWGDVKCAQLSPQPWGVKFRLQWGSSGTGKAGGSQATRPCFCPLGQSGATCQLTWGCFT